MVYLLVRLHAGKEVRLNVVIGPADVKVKVCEWVSLEKPFILPGDVFDDSVLCV